VFWSGFAPDFEEFEGERLAERGRRAAEERREVIFVIAARKFLGNKERMRMLLCLLALSLASAHAEEQTDSQTKKNADALKEQTKNLVVLNAEHFLKNTLELIPYNTFGQTNVAVDVKAKKTKSSTTDNYRTSWGSYDKDTTVEKIMSVEIRSVNLVSYAAVEFFWKIQIQSNKATLFQRCEPELLYDGKKQVEFSVATERNDTNFRLAGVQRKDGEKVVGWIARCINLVDGQVLGVTASSQELERIGKAGTLLAKNAD